jgi:SAM-dependent methyltransferase
MGPETEAYYCLYERNYQVAYAAGDAFFKERVDWESTLGPALELLARTGRRPTETHVLDVGCGDGTIALALAQAGYAYTGIDVAPSAICRARERAAAAGADVRFVCGDALCLSGALAGRFDVVLDVRCYHMLVLDQDRRRHLGQVAQALAVGGHLVMLEDHDEAALEACVSSFAAYRVATGQDEVEYRPKRRSFLRRRASGKVCIVERPVRQRQYVSELTQAGYTLDYLNELERPCGLVGLIARRATPT